uniref:Galectin n=1 Tax=Sphaeramia orbicularis TaxID=375764 RepID=A0A672YBE5_9TELE
MLVQFHIQPNMTFPKSVCLISMFAVNLQCGSKPNADIALHVNPRYDSGPAVVVTNTLQRGSWGVEERKPNSHLPSGSPFNLVITVTQHAFQVTAFMCSFLDTLSLALDLIQLHLSGCFKIIEQSGGFLNRGTAALRPHTFS